MSSITIPGLRWEMGAIIEQMPGYFLWKDSNSRYLTGSLSTAKLFGLKSIDELNGITDYDIPCEAAKYADLFVKQDQKVKETLSSILVLDVHPYVNNELKTLLISKSTLKNNQDDFVGIGCYCIEVTNQVLKDVVLHVAKTNKKSTNNKKIVRAANYYVNSQYGDLKLSNRQSECLFYLIRGKSVSMIAKILKLSPRTVESHVNEIKNRMFCNTKAEVIEKAIEKGYLEILPGNILTGKLSSILN